MIIKNAYVFREDNKFTPQDIIIENEIITDNISTEETVIDASGLYAIPGLADIHFHGCAGYDFCDGNHTALKKMAEYQAKNGITTMCPTSMTLNEEMLTDIFRAAASYQSREGADFAGIHMEGPFISAAKKGAQNEKFIHRPDINMFRRLQEESGNRIRLVTVAPEEPGAMEFIMALKEEVKISLAHTGADYDTAMKAYSHGAKHLTHMYNAMPPFTHRAPGVIGAAFDTPKCEVELICDGIHVHPSVIRATFQMFGDDRIIMISDSMMAAGMPEGEYMLGGQLVKVCEKRAELVSDGTIAGSVTNLMDCLRYVVKQVGIPFESAIKCASVNPVKSIGLYSQYGSINIGKIANIVLLDKDLNISKVILRGKIVS